MYSCAQKKEREREKGPLKKKVVEINELGGQSRSQLVVAIGHGECTVNKRCRARVLVIGTCLGLDGAAGCGQKWEKENVLLLFSFTIFSSFSIHLFSSSFLSLSSLTESHSASTRFAWTETSTMQALSRFRVISRPSTSLKKKCQLTEMGEKTLTINFQNKTKRGKAGEPGCFRRDAAQSRCAESTFPSRSCLFFFKKNKIKIKIKNKMRTRKFFDKLCRTSSKNIDLSRLSKLLACCGKKSSKLNVFYCFFFKKKKNQH